MTRTRHYGARAALLGLFSALLAMPTGSQPGASPQRDQRGVPNRELEDAMRIPEQGEPQLFGATVSRVRVDVIVTDADGDFVLDLGPDDFAVYEDGQRQEILDVQLVDLAAGEVHPLLAGSGPDMLSPREVDSGESAPATAQRGPASDSSADADPTEPTTSDLGAVIFLVDGPSLNPRARARFGDAWEGLLTQTDNPTVPRAAYMIDNVGRLEELVPLGYDTEGLMAAAETIRAQPFIGTSMNRRMIEIVSDLTDPNAGENARQIAMSKARTFEAEERNRALATYALLSSFADALWARSGRTAVVWVSTGIKLMQGGPYAALFAENPSALAEGMAGARFDVVSPDPQIKNAQEELHRAANGSNVSFYTLDPTLLTETRDLSVDVEVGTGGGYALLNTPVIQQSIDGLRDSMRMAANETGGKSFIHATDIGMILEEIESDTSRFYLLSYEPPGPDGDGDYHEIRVDVLRQDTNVRARGGYVDHDAGERVKRLVAAALALPGSVTDLPVDAEAFRSRTSPDDPNVLLAVAVDGSELDLMITQAREQRVSIDVHTAAFRNGELVDEAHEQLSAQSSADGSIRLDSENALEPTLVGFMAYQREWALEAGRYTFNVAVVDNVSGRVGATSVDVEIPEDVPAWGISDPFLVTIDEAGRPHPIVAGRVIPGQNIAAFVEVYGGRQPILSGQVFQEADDITNQQGAKLFPVALRLSGAVHRGFVPLPTGMPPGSYFVQLAVTDPGAGEHQIVRMPIEVIPPRGN